MKMTDKNSAVTDEEVSYKVVCVIFVKTAVTDETNETAVTRPHVVKTMVYNTEAEARSIYEEATAHADPFMFGLREIREGVRRFICDDGISPEDLKVGYYLESNSGEVLEIVCDRPVALFLVSLHR